MEDDRPHRVWRTVTPADLPESAARRCIDPTRRLEQAKTGEERAAECARAAGSVVQALRHAEVRLRPKVIRFQREPFEANGERVETFAEGTRFSKHRLWHVEVEFHERIPGPLVIGDGCFLGLGIMAPVQGSSAASVNRG
ncbi:MAG: type I-U CRISPR-associated protein Csb2 [Bryobacteraceae bacterium]